MPAQAPLVTLVNRRPLEQLEGVIDRGLRSYIEVGDALAEIKERQLYRPEYSLFEKYVERRFGISRSYAYRQIEGAKVAAIVAIGDIPAPAHEAQARVLAKVGVEEMLSFWQEARERFGDQPTAEQIQNVILPNRQNPRAGMPSRFEVMKWLQAIRHSTRKEYVQLELALEEAVERPGYQAESLERELRETGQYFLGYADQIAAWRAENPDGQTAHGNVVHLGGA